LGSAAATLRAFFDFAATVRKFRIVCIKTAQNIDSAAKLTGKLKLTNSSTDQTVRLVGGKILFIDAQGQPIRERRRFLMGYACQRTVRVIAKEDSCRNNNNNNDRYGRHRSRYCLSNRKEIQMNWNQIEGNWKQFKGIAKQQWGKLTDDQLDVIAGKREQLSGKIQEAYGITKDETEKQLSDWQGRQKEMDQSKTDQPKPKS
jgi:uncharacterized protein YjbJ (UPF0337 family)